MSWKAVVNAPASPAHSIDAPIADASEGEDQESFLAYFKLSPQKEVATEEMDSKKQEQSEKNFSCPELNQLHVSVEEHGSRLISVDDLRSVLNSIRSHDSMRNSLRISSEISFKILSQAMIETEGGRREYYDYVREKVKTVTEGRMSRHECRTCGPNKILADFLDVQIHIENVHPPQALFCQEDFCERRSSSTFEFIVHRVFDHIFDHIINVVETSNLDREQ